MITYKDHTFCSNRECKKDCYKKLTPEIERAAEAYGLPVAVAEYICLEKNDDGVYELNETMSEV